MYILCRYVHIHFLTLSSPCSACARELKELSRSMSMLCRVYVYVYVYAYVYVYVYERGPLRQRLSTIYVHASDPTTGRPQVAALAVGQTGSARLVRSGAWAGCGGGLKTLEDLHRPTYLLRCSDRRGQPRLLKAGSCCMHAASAWSMSISFRILLAAGPRVVFRLRRCMLCTRASRPLL